MGYWCFRIIIGQLRPLPANFMTSWNSKIWIFSIFGQIWQLFFFKIRFGAILVLEALKMVFLQSWCHMSTQIENLRILFYFSKNEGGGDKIILCLFPTKKNLIFYFPFFFNVSLQRKCWCFYYSKPRFLAKNHIFEFMKK